MEGHGLSFDNCSTLAETLASSNCKMEWLKLIQCPLLANGDEVVASAISRTTTLKWLFLEGSFQDESLRLALASSLPRNASIETLYIKQTDRFASRQEDEFILNLVKDIAV